MKLLLPILSTIVLLSSHSAFAAKKMAQAAAGAMVAGEARDCVGNACAVSAAVSCDDEPDAEVCNVQPTYGGIKQRYVVKGCRVTIYNDGPVEMVNEKTGQWCDAPLPKDHVFNQPTRSYQDSNGCQISEYSSASGLGVGVADCSAAPVRKPH